MDQKYQFDHKLKIAGDFEAQGKPLHAAQIYNALLVENPESVELYFRLANLYEQMGNITPAANLLKEFLENDPENKEVRLFLGQYFLRNSKWDEAVETLSYILPQDEPIVFFFIGYAHFMLKEYELAKINFINFVSNDRQSELLHEANIYLAKIELIFKNFESALIYAKKADGMYSNYWELNKIYAETYFNLGMYAHAVDFIEKAIKLNPDESVPYEWAGKIYLKLGDYLKAEKNFLKYIESIEDASSDIYTKLAEACLKAQKTQDALAYYDIAIKLDPENKTALAGKTRASSLLNNNVVSDGKI
ncbi:MAG: tetratricopeptide repeat protein [Ignavibacteriaceae bacterium]|nr:tetratricopeptide repeat protein [Ignavibacteriaceae bacterium]